MTIATSAWRLGAAALLLALGVSVGTPIAARSDAPAVDAAASIKQIDTECLAIQNAVMALHPIHVALMAGQWKVLSDSDFTVAEQTKSAVVLVDAWKQGSSYAWIHAHVFDSKGDQRATQLCYRQSDGTLERARQATTVPDLDSASAVQAYFASDGTLIQKMGAFEMNDPAVAKTVKALPFYSALP